jgi:hypothetical protein
MNFALVDVTSHEHVTVSATPEVKDAQRPDYILLPSTNEIESALLRGRIS